ncbi:unnamed protein product [Musa textilis]
MVLKCGIVAQSFIFQEEEEDLFFESQEDISSVFDSCLGSPTKDDLLLEDQFSSQGSIGPLCDVWITSSDGVRERRDRFMRWMGIDIMNGSFLSSSDPGGQTQVDDEIQPDTDRIMSSSGSVLRGFDIDSKYSISSGSTEDEHPIKNLDDRLISLPKVGSNQIVAFDEFKGSLGPSSLNQQLMLREDKASSKSDSSVRRKRTGWLRKLGAVACILDRQGEESNSSFHDSDKSGIAGSGRVKVKPCGKRSKKFSAVYKMQDIKAHDGAILTMKFSPDDQYLASGGAEGIVRVWHVMVCGRTNEISIPDDDPSCIYFTMNHSAELTPVHADKKNTFKSRDMRRSEDSACVIIPPDVFQLSEKPLHAFHGHDADVLDLSWSSDKHLLSSSKDKTVRLWQVGSGSCLKVFSHINYVTCVQYNPIDENYFISGSIDGKVRIWNISRGQVVDWVDIREIVTAVCYCPNGKGVVVGTLTGGCCFYDASGKC